MVRGRRKIKVNSVNGRRKEEGGRSKKDRDKGSGGPKFDPHINSFFFSFHFLLFFTPKKSHHERRRIIFQKKKRKLITNLLEPIKDKT